VWGNLTDAEHIVWGNADSVLANSDGASGSEEVVQEPEPPLEP
jgi:hypothetical protein